MMVASVGISLISCAKNRIPLLPAVSGQAFFVVIGTRAVGKVA
jgi:hypothetical protein